MHPEWMNTYADNKELSYETLVYLQDVSIYFAEVLVRNNRDKIKWGFLTRPKNLDFLN